MDQIASIDPASRRADYFKTHFFKLVLGTLSLPINLPGTNYRNGVQVRSLILFHILVLIDTQMHDNFFYEAPTHY